MRRGFGFQQQSYGIRHEDQQQSYSVHQESSWHSKDEYVFSGVQIVHSLCLDSRSQLMNHNSKFDGGQWHAQNLNRHGWCGSGGKQLMPFMGVNVINESQFSQGASVFDNVSMERAKYDIGLHEVVHVPGTIRAQEMRYERARGGDLDDHDLQYFHEFDDNVKWKRNGCRRSEWILKGA